MTISFGYYFFLIKGVMDCLKHTSKVINVDQPKGDVFNQSTLVLFNKNILII